MSKVIEIETCQECPFHKADHHMHAHDSDTYGSVCNHPERPNRGEKMRDARVGRQYEPDGLCPLPDAETFNESGLYD